MITGAPKHRLSACFSVCSTYTKWHLKPGKCRLHSQGKCATIVQSFQVLLVLRIVQKLHFYFGVREKSVMEFFFLTSWLKQPIGFLWGMDQTHSKVLFHGTIGFG